VSVLSLFGDRSRQPRRPGGRTYRRIRNALMAAPVLLALPGLMTFHFPAADGADTSGDRPAAIQSHDQAPLTAGAAANSWATVLPDPATPGPGGPNTSGPGPNLPSSSADANGLVATPVPGSIGQPTPAPRPVATPNPTAKPTPKLLPPPPPPTKGPLALGVWSGQPWQPGSLDALKSLLGRNPKVFLTYVGWNRPFYCSDEQQIANRGASHVLTWEPTGYTPKAIASGAGDTFIRAWAKGAKACGIRIYLRPMHEMNGDWYPWGRGVNGNTPTDFVNAWRHMHNLFVAEGATNVKWVWSPNVRYGRNYPFADLYPGSAYVDWLALDGYNWGLDSHLGQPSWQSFEQIFGASYREITALAPGKPLMIAETASTENGGIKAQWILQTFLYDAPKYPVVRAMIWFNQADGASNFKINSSAASLAAFRQVLSSATFSGRLP
jgi:hypothetical protein